MKNLKNKLLICLFAVASMTTVNAATELEVLIEKASTAREKASQLGFEWTATKGLIESAKIANAEGKKELAKTLAQRALNQAENGIKQAEYSDQHWQDNFPE